MFGPSLLPLLTALLAVGVLGYAALENDYALMAASAMLLAALTWSLRGAMRWLALLAYPLAFVAAVVISPAELDPTELLTALLVMGGLALIVYRDQTTVRELEWSRNTVDALKVGSERLARAGSAEEVIEAGIEMIDGLHLAPNVAYLAYRGGSPQVVAGRGAFAEHVGQPIFPSHNDSRSVQADHWVVEEALHRLDRSQRVRYLPVPVNNHDTQHLGTVLLARPAGHNFHPETEGVLYSFGRLLGAQLGQFEAIHELKEAQDLSLRTLGGVLEQRDNETAGHTGRVVDLSVRLGRSLGWREEKITALRWGAYLHDLGKIAIPDAVLHKPGGLTPSERKVMESHAKIGYDLLQNLHFLPTETLDLVRYHHEKWDGGGYPAGLRGRDIPETARVFSIVDVYDALTSARPYKEAWSQQQALGELQRQAGKHFDPDYVRAFVQMMQDEGGSTLIAR